MSKLPPNVPTRVVELDRPRTLALTLSALKRIRDITGSLNMELDEEAIFERAPSLVWASLVDEDREGVTPEDVGLMLHAGNLSDVVDAIGHLANTSAKGAAGNSAPAPAKVKAGKRTAAKK